MKKILLPLAAVMLLAMAVPAFAEWELGSRMDSEPKLEQLQ